MKPLYGKIAVVTGVSRSTGIGTAICLSLADAGADIFFTHWTPFDKVEGKGAEEYWTYPRQVDNCKKDYAAIEIRYSIGAR
ncbi:hypothetical protein IKQ_05297 [Bacillus cereus VDM053]|nr:hypothetical protein IKQ_05297 [Bacillus cereus VDM053]